MDVRKNVYLIFKEATNNMVKYADADRAFFSVTGTKGNLTMLIRDNGRGFDEETVLMRPGSIGVGLSGMKQRAQELGGELHLANTKPGSSVEVIIPLKSEKSSDEESSVAAMHLKN